MTDRALVIGIGRYLELGPRRTPIHLQGPVNDATDMAGWLQEQGSHVTLVTSDGDGRSTWQVTDLRPEFSDVERPFNGLVRDAENEYSNGRPVRLGRRLTIYMAGHGFVPDAQHLALLTAEASNQYRMSIQATSWADWFAKQTPFDEIVLYMDCCTVSDYAQASRGPLANVISPRMNGNAKMVTVWAAPPDQLAYENPDSNGIVRGNFTKQLMAGLRGAAADPLNQVTTSSLLRYFQASGLSGADDTDAGDTRLRPFFRDRDELVLAAGVQPPPFTVRTNLQPPAAVRIEGEGARVVFAGPVSADGEIVIPAATGIYVVRSAGMKGFFEIGAGDVSVDVHLS